MIKKAITYDFNNTIIDRIKGPSGISVEEIESYIQKASEIHNILASKREIGGLPFYELPYRKDEVEEIHEMDYIDDDVIISSTEQARPFILETKEKDTLSVKEDEIEEEEEE